MITVRTVRVIGCGNPAAGDDAAGILAVRAARPRLEAIPGVEVAEAGAGLQVLHLLDDVDAVIVVDAVRSRRPDRTPGVIVRLEAGPEGLPRLGSAISSHGFGVADTVGLAAAMGTIPRLIVMGVEAGDVRAGEPLSKPVAQALPELVRSIVREVEGLLGEGVP